MLYIGLVDIVLIVVYLFKSPKLTTAKINKKLYKSVVAAMFFSAFGIIKTYMLYYRVVKPLTLTTYFLVDLLVIVGSMGTYKKKKLFIIIYFVTTSMSMYLDTLIDKSTTLPITVFIIFLRSLFYISIVWEGFIGFYVYCRNSIKGVN